MNFVRTEFLGFFAVVFAVYWAIRPQRGRMLWLLAASCVFYMSWNPWFILLIFGSTSVDYLVALRLERTTATGRRRWLVALSVLANLSILGYFKYAVFALASAARVTNWLGMSLDVPALKVILPLGISFYTFEAISYIVDVYRGKIRAVKRPLDYAIYILFFPHLVAGPIVRSGDFLPQLRRRKRFSWLKLQFGVQLMLVGLIKKAVIADHLAVIVDPVFKTPGAYAASALWLAVLGYAVQIYCDFSGYSDMAIGLARMLGFKLAINFRMPYFASGLSDFWRRWHISLSSWLRDYLYVPFGGNRGGTWFTCRNLLLTMTLGGLWHGANWTFLAWGVYHGLLLVGQKLCPAPRWFAGAWTRLISVPLTFLAVCVGWVFFRAMTLGDAWTILSGMFAFGRFAGAGQTLTPAAVSVVGACLLAAVAAHFVGTFSNVRRWDRWLPAPLAGAALAAALALYLLLLPLDGKGFIYFQF